jgi:chromosome segregation ATPase
MPEVLTSENLDAFYAERLNLATEPAPETVEEPTAAVEVESSEAPEQKESTEQEEVKKPNTKLEKRFSDLTKQREAARQEAAAERAKREELESRLAALERKEAPVEAPKADARPTPDQFSDAFEYAEKLAEWSARKAIEARDQAEADRKAQERQQTVITTWAQRLESAKAEMPDFDAMVASSDVAVSDQIRDAILESEVGPRVLYHLAENPEVAEKWKSMSTAGALRELGKLEARFESKPEQKPVQRPKAAQPINPLRAVAAGAVLDVDSDGEFRGDFQAYKAARLAGKIR